MNKERYEAILFIGRIPVKCHNCGHEWGTASKALSVVCPGCHGTCNIRLPQPKIKESKRILDVIQETHVEG